MSKPYLGVPTTSWTFPEFSSLKSPREILATNFSSIGSNSSNRQVDVQTYIHTYTSYCFRKIVGIPFWDAHCPEQTHFQHCYSCIIFNLISLFHVYF